MEWEKTEKENFRKKEAKTNPPRPTDGKSEII